jgi:peptide-methionine (R)-S-oxide reductase
MDFSHLTPEEHTVLRESGTEPPFTGKYTNTFEDGTYTCKACNAVLFDSNTKFKSHCGWPAFDGAKADAVTFTSDNAHGITRTEVRCATCDSHLGHVFDDGPKDTTGKRFCINSIALKHNQ